MGRNNLITLLCFIAFVIVFPWLAAKFRPDYIEIVKNMGLTAMITIGLSLLLGYAGQISLGHAAFVGIGGYTSLLTMVKILPQVAPHSPVLAALLPWLSIPAGMIISVAVAYLVGWPSLKLRGHYLAMATLGFCIIVYTVFNGWEEVFGGSDGVRIGERVVTLNFFSKGFQTWATGAIKSVLGLAPGDMTSFDDFFNFYFIWLWVILILWFSLNLIHSRIGRALRSIHGSEVASAAMGVNVARTKVNVFVLSAAFASMAGSFYALLNRFFEPPMTGFSHSIEYVVMVIIGGMSNIWGALLGTGLLSLLPDWLADLGVEDWRVFIFALILLLIVMWLPGGLFSIPVVARNLKAKYFGGKGKVVEARSAGE